MDEIETPASSSTSAPSVQLRVKFFLTGVIYPLFAILLSFDGPAVVGTVWQSGEWGDYAAMLMTWPGFGPFLPFVGLCMVALSAYVFRPALSESVYVRFGVYVGVVIALQFLVITTVMSGLFTFVFAVVVLPVQAAIIYGLGIVVSRMGRFTIRHLLILTAAVAVLIAIVRWLQISQEVYLVSVAGFCVAASAPVLCLVTFVRAAKRMFRQGAVSGIHPIVRFCVPWAWFVAWFFSWKLAIDIMFDEYAKLPTSPNCYVCSAAAHGHAVLVRSVPRTGDRVLVNEQMQQLKFLEFAMEAGFPRFHRLVRRIYDRFGPPIAQRCKRHIWLADASFVVFWPLQCISRAVAFLTRVPQSRIKRLYIN
ncbi:hypothetical protein Poly51_45160 [Rubripirellula tenax]|uniref:DUF6688 domain-containing protein n=1 Tax=Rubripirellula tenax TaxID=2528015 RepID=A0A5C6EJM1_9BACT|nr:DUF6688 family protein [Rubripirellula tenax]TWU48615.1 hypothetical protein Poly51_45160 [Rubripirellula tenax]